MFALRAVLVVVTALALAAAPLFVRGPGRSFDSAAVYASAAGSPLLQADEHHPDHDDHGVHDNDNDDNANDNDDNANDNDGDGNDNDDNANDNDGHHNHDVHHDLTLD